MCPTFSNSRCISRLNSTPNKPSNISSIPQSRNKHPHLTSPHGCHGNLPPRPKNNIIPSISKPAFLTPNTPHPQPIHHTPSTHPHSFSLSGLKRYRTPTFRFTNTCPSFPPNPRTQAFIFMPISFSFKRASCFRYTFRTSKSANLELPVAVIFPFLSTGYPELFGPLE